MMGEGPVHVTKIRNQHFYYIKFQEKRARKWPKMDYLRRSSRKFYYIKFFPRACQILTGDLGNRHKKIRHQLCIKRYTLCKRKGGKLNPNLVSAITGDDVTYYLPKWLLRDCHLMKG